MSEIGRIMHQYYYDEYQRLFNEMIEEYKKYQMGRFSTLSALNIVPGCEVTASMLATLSEEFNEFMRHRNRHIHGLAISECIRAYNRLQDINQFAPDSEEWETMQELSAMENVDKYMDEHGGVEAVCKRIMELTKHIKENAERSGLPHDRQEDFIWL